MLTIKLSLELGQHQGHRLGSSCSGGHNVEGSCASSPQVAVRSIQQPLVSSVGVGRRHSSLDNTELLVQDLKQTKRASIAV